MDEPVTRKSYCFKILATKSSGWKNNYFTVYAKDINDAWREAAQKLIATKSDLTSLSSVKFYSVEQN